MSRGESVGWIPFFRREREDFRPREEGNSSMDGSSIADISVGASIDSLRCKGWSLSDENSAPFSTS